MTSRTLCRADLLLARAGVAGAVLGLDTGSPIASIALVVGGRLAGETARAVTSHGAALPQTVAQLLERAELRASDLTGIAVGIGPGSFTGLRIGLSYAKGLAFASGAKIIGVASLDALAAGALDAPTARPGLQVCALLDARKGEVYAALYEIVADGLEKISQDVVMPLVTSPSECDSRRRLYSKGCGGPCEKAGHRGDGSGACSPGIARTLHCGAGRREYRRGEERFARLPRAALCSIPGRHRRVRSA